MNVDSGGRVTAGPGSAEPERLPRIPFAVPDITDLEVQAATRAIQSGWVTSGPEMRLFEEDFAQSMGTDVEAVATNSATAGLHLALEALDIGPGDEVIIPTWTFTATAAVVMHAGAKPVLVDVDQATLNIDLDRVREALTSATKAVLPVHFAGLGVDTKQLRAVVGPDVRIIEDAAHALPTVTDGSRVGACDYTDAAVFSFYATKTITTGEGGMITTRNSEIASRARIMRLHGIDRDAFDRYRSDKPAWFYDVAAAGYKYNLPDPAAAMGRVQLSRSDSMHRRRKALASRYLQELGDLPLQLPSQAPEQDTHAWHLFIIRLLPGAPMDRDGFVRQMADLGIGTSVHFTPLHMHSHWRNSLGLTPADFPVATEHSERVVSLPLFSSISDSDFDRVVEAVRKVLL